MFLNCPLSFNKASFSKSSLISSNFFGPSLCLNLIQFDLESSIIFCNSNLYLSQHFVVSNIYIISSNLSHTLLFSSGATSDKYGPTVSKKC